MSRRGNGRAGSRMGARMATRGRIDGVDIVALRVIADERGAVMHMLRADAPHFRAFGEVYFSLVNPGVVKGWKRHRQMWLSLAVPSGRVRLVMFDDREGSPTRGSTQDAELGADAAIYRLAIVPPGVWTAFKGLGSTPALVANCASLPHDPAEADNRPLADPPVAIEW